MQHVTSCNVSRVLEGLGFIQPKTPPVLHNIEIQVQEEDITEEEQQNHTPEVKSSVCLSVCLPVCLSVCLPVCLSMLWIVVVLGFCEGQQSG